MSTERPTRGPTKVKAPTSLNLGTQKGRNNDFHEENSGVPASITLIQSPSIPGWVKLAGIVVLGLSLLFTIYMLLQTPNTEVDPPNTWMNMGYEETASDNPGSIEDAQLFIAGQNDVIGCFREAVAQIEANDVQLVANYGKDRVKALQLIFDGMDSSLSHGEKQVNMAEMIMEAYCELQQQGIPVEECIEGMTLRNCP